ncbi:MAG: hypothetical protein AB7U75_01730 [Hyphomicrobiaceae bacterium]
MSTEQTLQRCGSPACKSAVPGGCSDCTLAYDCARASGGVPLAWPLVALLLVGIVTLVVGSFAG